MKVRHKETGNEYTVLHRNVFGVGGVCCGCMVVVYEKDGTLFHRETEDFYTKFEMIAGGGDV